MKKFTLLLSACFYCSFLAAEFSVEEISINQAVLGFNHVVSNSTDAVSNCDKRNPPEVIFEQGMDANKLYLEVGLSIERPIPVKEFEGDVISVISRKQAEVIFREFSEVGYMKFDYLHDGCETRAHEFAMIAKANGIEMGKAMAVFGDGNSGGLFPKEWKEKEERGESIPVPEGFVGWKHHVAPYVLVHDGGEIKPFVFDVGVANGIKNLDDWRVSLVNRVDQETKILIKERAVIHPDTGPRSIEESYISSEINKQKLIREMGIWEFEYWNEKGLLNY